MSRMRSWALVAAVLVVCCIHHASAESDGFAEEIGRRVDRVRNERHLNQFFTRPGQCGFSPLVVVYGKRKPDLEEVEGIWPVAKFDDDRVEYIPRSKWSCLKKVKVIPGTLIVYDDGQLGDMEEFSNIIQVSGHIIFKGAGSKSGPGLKTLSGFRKLGIIIQSLNILDMNDLEGLDGFESLRQVGENIVLWNTGKIKTLKGLHRMSRIGQTLYLDNNRGLTSLEGLERLEQIGFDLFLKGNGQIKDLAPLKNLKKVFGNIIIDGNNALTTLKHLKNLEEIGIGIDVSNSEGLKDLEGFEGLTEVTGDIFVMKNPALESLDGLDNVKEIGLNLIISQNNALDDLTALSKCKKVAGLISIADNQALTSLKGLKGITTIGEDLLIQRNPQLKTLEDLSVRTVGTNLGGNIVVDQNWNLVEFGLWPKRLKEVQGGVRIQRNSDNIDQDAVAIIKSKAVES